MNEPDGNSETRVALFQKREIRRAMYNNEWWFVITDIIAALTDSTDPSGYWKKMRKRDPDLGKACQEPGTRNICLTPSWRCVHTTDGLDLTEATCACRLVPSVVRPAQRPVSGRRTGVL